MISGLGAPPGVRTKPRRFGAAFSLVIVLVVLPLGLLTWCAHRGAGEEDRVRRLVDSGRLIGLSPTAVNGRLPYSRLPDEVPDGALFVEIENFNTNVNVELEFKGGKVVRAKVHP